MSLLSVIEPAAILPGDAVPAAPAVHVRASVAVEISPRYGQGARMVLVDYALRGPRNAPVVIVQGGISATRDAFAEEGGGWWQEVVGPGRFIDTTRVRVLGIDWLDAEQLEVEAVGSEDQADAIAEVLAALGIRRAAAFVGASYGAMVGLAFAARHPARLGRVVAIAGAHRPHPLASAQRAVQRGILQLGLDHGCEQEAVALARQLALTTYRGNAEFATRFSGAAERRDGRWRLPVESWLEHNAGKFASRWSARRYIALSQSIDLHAVDPADIRVPTSLIGIASDRLVPLADLCALQQALGGRASLDVIDSPCGHDGFLTEAATLGPLVAEILERAERPAEAAPPRSSATAGTHLRSA